MSNFRTIKQIIRNALDVAFMPFQVGCDQNSSRYQKLESLIPPYTLPDPLVMVDGRYVKNVRMWFEQRRPEILELFKNNVFGQTPSQTFPMSYTVTSVNDHVLYGIGSRKEVKIGLVEKMDAPTMALLIYLPNNAKKRGKKVPLFLGLNFYGNHTIHKDTAITITRNWIPNDSVTRGRTPDMLRGIQSSSWPIEFILRHGYGLATVYCGDIVPDRNNTFDQCIIKWLPEHETGNPLGDSWGAIGGWAWGLSRAMDYLERDTYIDSNKIIVIGHSRLGKAALWAGAQDKRFAMVISNESGCGGAALFRRKLGETVAQINSSYPHWFCDNFKHYNDKESDLPIDQHELIGLIAPRPVYVASAQLDLHADPMGEFLAAKNANPVYRLLGTVGLPADVLPPINRPVMGNIGYHIRKGYHGITSFDWAQFIMFANMHFINR